MVRDSEDYEGEQTQCVLLHLLSRLVFLLAILLTILLTVLLIILMAILLAGSLTEFMMKQVLLITSLVAESGL
jgi:hypothetical protein